jgi:fibronectin-binding autotransporter adhesin
MFRWNLMLRNRFASFSPVRKSSLPTLFGILREKLKVWCRVIGGHAQALFLLPKARVPRPSVKPSLQGLEDRLVPSTSATAPPGVATMASQMVATIDQEMATLANAMMSLEQVIVQAYTQEVSYVEQQVDHLLGINPTVQNSSLNTTMPQTSSPDSSSTGGMPVVSMSGAGSGRGNGSGAGSGSGATTTADNGSNQSVKTGTQSAGRGSGSGSGAATAHGNATSQGAIKPLLQPSSGGSGSGSAGSGGIGSGSIGSGTGTGTGSGTVYGQVWLDNNGDGSIDNGEMGYQGITVGLLNATTGSVIDTVTTDANGDYKFTLSLAPLPHYQSFQVQVYLNSVPNVPFQATRRGVSQINAQGTSGVFELANGGWRNIKAGIRSLTVTTTDDDAGGAIKNQITLRDAIETANTGLIASPKITFKSGLSGTIELQDILPDLDNNMTIWGPGASQITINGGSLTGFLILAGTTCEINGLGITNCAAVGGAGSGAGVYNAGDLTLTNDVIYNNKANYQGGGILNLEDAELTLTTCIVTGNSAGQYGGGIANYGKLIVCCSSQIYSNQAGTTETDGNGGGISNGPDGEITVKTNCKIYNNTANAAGGGIYNSAGTVTISTGAITGNTAGQTGGGIFVDSGTLILKNGVTINSNTSYGRGGGIYEEGSGEVKMSGGSIASNQANAYDGASGGGGGLYVSGSKLTLTDGVLVSRNKALGGAGGGIYIDEGGTETVSGGTIAFNTTQSTWNGGGIYNLAGNLTLKGVYVGPDNAANQGGGMYLATNSQTTFAGLTNTTVSGNSASAGGVGIYEQGNARVFPLNLKTLSDNDDPGGNPVQGP